ncbi:hypothetical protein PPSIR1_12853 [Plesiocystis pacifica SIR-1]|uniref:ABC transporter permease n=1 Tax=Plesiocystis pacifica SIR-1 TaxID=391625 RepID=A6G075_9BACT|nr:ABC-2 family transporter protein [Plesiocystis pacifica]EDM80772.1 hypothetical protein PPSIR1_12853 [Plesiocystis pacifica SIR-1]
MPELGRNLRYVAAALRVSVLAALEYRVGFWTEAVLGVIWSLAGAAPLVVALEHRPDIAGWTPWEVVLLSGFYLIFAGAFGALIEPPLFETMNHIRRGTLDYVLLRPVDSLLACMVSAFQPWRSLEMLAGAALVVVAALRLELRPGPEQLAMLAGALACGFTALYALGVLALSLSFRAMQLQNLAFLMESSIELARWPISVFRGPLKAVFTFVIPFAVMTSYPAQALLGRLDLGAAVGALVTAAALAGLARVGWARGVKNYTSASS